MKHLKKKKKRKRNGKRKQDARYAMIFTLLRRKSEEWLDRWISTYEYVHRWWIFHLLMVVGHHCCKKFLVHILWVSLKLVPFRKIMLHFFFFWRALEWAHGNEHLRFSLYAAENMFLPKKKKEFKLASCFFTESGTPRPLAGSLWFSARHLMVRAQRLGCSCWKISVFNVDTFPAKLVYM